MGLFGKATKKGLEAGYTHKHILQSEHLALAAELGDAFGGNDDFEELRPKELMRVAVAKHDAGWIAADAKMTLDAGTMLPRNLLFSPPGTGLEVVPESVRLAQQAAGHSLYVGLMVSMHHVGLQKRRFNMGGGKIPALTEMAKEKERLTGESSRAASAGDAEANERMLAEMTEFQAGVVKTFSEAGSADEKEWVSHDRLWSNYKALQFFDTLSLYFCLAPPEERTELTCKKVPVNATDDADVVVTPVPESAAAACNSEANTYSVSPYPFNRSPLTVHMEGVFIKPADGDPERLTTMDVRAAGEAHVETITLVRG